MKPEKEPKMGSCYECCVKEEDSSQKQVYYCDLCGKWFCERHREPKFPYFVDWDTIFDVQGNPGIKLLFHTEYRRGDGHPDLVYWRKTIETLKIEENKRNEMIKRAIDRMMNAEKHMDLTVDSDLDRRKSVEILKKEERALRKWQRKNVIAVGNQETTITTGNKYGHRFVVPSEVYSNATYREYLDYAETMRSVKVIVDEYFEKYGKRKKMGEPEKKKHWWQ